MDINLELYKVFYHVAQQGSITQAAKTMRISQPAVSQSIKNLESFLGSELFIRNPKGVHLTQAGQVLFEYIEKAYELILEGEKRFAETLVHSQTLRIGTSDTLCKNFLMPYLSAFSQQYPDIPIHVTNKTTPEVLKLLELGSVDLCVASLPIQSPNFHVQHCMTLHDVPVCGTTFYQTITPSMPLMDLGHHPLCLLGPESNTRQHIEQHFQSRHVPLHPAFELSSSDLLTDFAKNNMGISFVILEFVLDALADGSLYEIILDDPIPERGIGLVTMPSMPMTLGAQYFMRLVNEK